MDPQHDARKHFPRGLAKPYDPRMGELVAERAPRTGVDAVRRWHDRQARWYVVRLAVLAGWLAMIVVVLVFGERPVPLSRLDSAVTSGSVSSVEVTPGLPRGAEGSTHQEAHWRQGLRGYVVEVRQVSGRGADGSEAGVRPVLTQDLGARLRADNPDVRVVRVGDRFTGTEMFGRRLPATFEGVRAVLGLASLVLLLFGPDPWRATRPAWGWLALTSGAPTYAALAFLALSGPTPGLSHPRPGARRLRAVWAVLLALVLYAFFAS